MRWSWKIARLLRVLRRLIGLLLQVLPRALRMKQVCHHYQSILSQNKLLIIVFLKPIAETQNENSSLRNETAEVSSLPNASDTVTIATVKQPL